MKKLTLLLVLLLVPLALSAGDKYKVWSYVSAYNLTPGQPVVENTGWGGYNFMPPDSISLSYIDVLVLFDNDGQENALRSFPWISLVGGQVDSATYFNGMEGAYPGATDNLITTMHGLGKKVVLEVTDQGDQDINYIALDSARSEGFGRSVAALCHRHDFDGYDINIESAFESATDAQLTRFFRIAKRTLDAEFTPDSSRTISIVPTPGWVSEYPAASIQYIDYLIPQYYGMKVGWDGCGDRGSGGISWPGNAYSRGTWASCYDIGNLMQDGAGQAIALGWPASKIIVGLFAQAYTWINGIDSIMKATDYPSTIETARFYTNRNHNAAHGLSGRYNGYTKQYEWGGTLTVATESDPDLYMPIGHKVFVSMPNDSTCRWIAKHIDSLGLGGAMTWVIDKELDTSKAKGAGRLATTEGLQNYLTAYDATEPPAAPTATEETNVTSSSFSANWNSVAMATGYYLDVSELDNFSTFVTGYDSLDVGLVTTKSVIGLVSSTTYYYRVRAYNGAGMSTSSNTITAVTSYSGGGGGGRRLLVRH